MGWGMGCYNCPAQIVGSDSFEVDRKAIAAGWKIGLQPSGQAYYCCPECISGLLSVKQITSECPECGSPSGHNATCPVAARERNAENLRLRAALEQIAAEWRSSPGTVMGAAAELGREFKRRQQIAADALSLI